MTAAVKAASHIGTAYVAAAAEVCSRFIGTCRDLGCTYSVYIQTRQVFLGRFNEGWLHRLRSPPFGSLFILSPLHTSFLFFSFMSSLASCHLISFLLLRAHCPALSLYMHNILSNQVSGCPGFYNEVGCHRLFQRTWFLFIATTHILVPSGPLRVFILLSYCAHTHTFALTLVLLASPRGGVCVCVPLVTGILLNCFRFVSSRGTGADLPIQSNEAMAFRWMSGLINHLYLHNF